MKIASRRPLLIAPNDPISKGLSQLHDGLTPPGRMSAPDLDERDDGEEDEDHDLRAEQPPLRARRGLDPDVADGAHQHDPDHPGDADPQRAARETRPAEEQEGVAPGDLGEARHHEDVGEDQAPAAEPAGDRPERPRAPGERRAAVRVGLVQVLEAQRDKQHRHEGQHHDDRRLEADPGHGRHRPERGCEAVRRRRRGDADHHARHEAERAGLQALVERLRVVDGHGDVHAPERSQIGRRRVTASGGGRSRTARASAGPAA